jgi:cobalt-precorrin-5B (C1)-methyltransferase
MKKLADNGKRRGRTTGTCAAAAAKAAALLLEQDQTVSKVSVRLPDEHHYLEVPIASLERVDDLSVRARVIKDAGDDPDATDGAAISCELRRNNLGIIRFFAGDGVGTVTEPGIRVAIGEPAINPVPRQMICQAVIDAVGEDQGFDISVGCENGAEIAKRTFNPRLGIKGGISILGTTGIVEPLSLAAYMASIEVYIKVALADGAESIALLPGNIGLGFASKELHLPKKRAVHISNYIGFALEHVDQFLTESGTTLERLFILGHPGKLAKMLAGHWDTHSRSSGMAMQPMSVFAREQGFDSALVGTIKNANTVEAVIEDLHKLESGDSFWRTLEIRLSQIAAGKTSKCKQVQVRLFDMHGKPLNKGGGAQ